ncbi:hypothetical protein BDQ17DRAFT_1418780 [Cyathus striatus]|nr:hypothetical protein BDQ17DRAFT_1418780 [Cyathus striatus]
MASLSSSSSPAPQIPPSKKPRHRHSPAQLAALNELFDKNEHPPLEQRTALAERLGMCVPCLSICALFNSFPFYSLFSSFAFSAFLREPKTVNAWFQNKRASSKKRTRGAPSDAPPINNTVPAPQAPPQNTQVRSASVEPDDYQDEDYTADIHMSHLSSSLQHDIMSAYPGNVDHTHFLMENDAMMPRRMRMRPTVEQTDELRKLYNLNPHPTAEQRQALAEQIGMRYQSITNWFQNQRSLAKKRKEDDLDSLPISGYPAEGFELRQYSGYPPPAHHPSLAPPLPFHYLPSPLPLRSQRSPSPPIEHTSPRRSLRRSTTPYSGSNFSRPRRSRPEPYQLDALKELYMKTATPTIEERSALALEIGMDVSKVTNWFRNLRQTARKRTKRGGNGDDDDYGGQGSYSTTASRSGTPSLHSSTSSMNDDSMEMDDFEMHDIPSDIGSEDEYQEPLTPSPEHSPSPPPAESSSRIVFGSLSVRAQSAYYDGLDDSSMKRYPGVRIEDALLLLSFHHHAVH